MINYYFCWFVCVIKQRGCKLNAGFIQQAMKRKAHMADNTIAQKSEIQLIRFAKTKQI